MMKSKAPIVLAAALLAGTACHRENKAAQLEALEKAYQSGVFTKEEYDVKKQSLMGTPPAAPAPPTAAAPPAANPPKAEAEEPEPAPLAGCDDPESRRSGGPKGVQERFYPASMDAVRKAAEAAFQNMDFVLHVDTANHMEASRRRHIGVVIGAGGERLVLHFSSARQDGQHGTRVTGETKKNLVGRLAQKSWTSAVLAQIGCNLHGRR